ncbi:MAG: hypothetical protein FWC80_01345 [Firmicutes bacterium]|nr:hypothetical protein [Bacillota bacterium]
MAIKVGIIAYRDSNGEFADPKPLLKSDTSDLIKQQSFLLDNLKNLWANGFADYIKSLNSEQASIGAEPSEEF